MHIYRRINIHKNVQTYTRANVRANHYTSLPYFESKGEARGRVYEGDTYLRLGGGKGSLEDVKKEQFQIN